MLDLGFKYEAYMGRNPGGGGGPGAIGFSKRKNKPETINKKDALIKQLQEENKRLRKDLDNMIKYAPGSEKYNLAKTHFESLQKINH